MAPGKHPPAWTRGFRRIFRDFLNEPEKKHIAEVIAEEERKTTGEIHVHLIGKAQRGKILAVAKKVFFELGLEKTDSRNGVLILISHLDHRFAIWGDEGIHSKAGQHLWDRAARTLTDHFAQRRYHEGIQACVREVGRELARHFPKADPGPGKDQLSNDVSQS